MKKSEENKIRKIILEVLTNKSDKCGCGCGKCDNKVPQLNEQLASKVIMTENMKNHLKSNKPLTENIFPCGSKDYLNLWVEARYLYSRNALNLYGEDKRLVTETKIGESLYNMNDNKEIGHDPFPLVKIGSILKHNLTGAEFKIDKINGKNIEGKYTKIGTLKGAKIGDRNKTNSDLIGKTYKIVGTLKEALDNNTQELFDLIKLKFPNIEELEIEGNIVKGLEGGDYSGVDFGWKLEDVDQGDEAEIEKLNLDGKEVYKASYNI